MMIENLSLSAILWLFCVAGAVLDGSPPEESDSADGFGLVSNVLATLSLKNASKVSDELLRISLSFQQDR